MEITLAGRLPLERLTDIETFITSAGHLKALTVQLQQRTARKSRLDAALVRQISEQAKVCADLVSKSPRLAELWRDVLAEIDAITADHGTP